MTVWELVQELSEYDANAQIIVRVTGEKVSATSILDDSDLRVNLDNVLGSSFFTRLHNGRVIMDVEV